MGIFQNNLMGAAAAAASAGGGDFYDYQIENSVRMSYDNNTTLKFTAGTPTSRKTFTYSWWWKRYNVTSTTTQRSSVFTAGTGGATYVFWPFTNSSVMQANFNFTGGNFGDSRLTTNMQFRDTSAWYHCVLRFDSTQATASNRVRLYVNGVEPTYSSATVQTDISQNEDISFMNQSGVVQSWGGITGVATGQEGVDVQLAEIVMCDGQSYGPDSFGEFKNGVWKPVDPSGLTFGNNGYYLKFESSSDLGNDSSGNNNDFTANNLATHDQMLDTPTFNSDSNGGNFATYNPLVPQGGAQKLMSLSEGNLHAESTTNDKYHQIIGTMGVKTGKWYIEWYIEAAGYPSWSVGWRHGSQLQLFDGGTQSGNANLAYVGYFTGSNVYIKAFGSTATADPQVAYSGWTSAGDAPTTGDVMMCAIDMDAGKVWWGFNGEWGDVGSGTGNPATGANASNTWTVADYTDHIFPFTLAWANPVTEIIMNCGQEGTFAGNLTAGGNADDTGYGNFKYSVPSGFKALCTGNLPTADAVDPAQTNDNYPQKMFQALTYTGNANNSRSITTRFDPDVMWFKRTDGVKAWNNYSKTQGIGDTSYYQQFDSTAYDGYNSGSYKGVISTASTSMTIGAVDYINGSGLEYVSYLFNMGGSQATNTDGSVTSYIYNSGAGMSVGKYTGESATRTVGHGLGVAPTYIIVKSIGAARNWAVYYGDNTEALQLNNTNATDVGVYWANTSPTSSVFTVGDSNETGKSEQYMFMAFANTEGFIKAGSYVGNGDGSNGPFVYTGFKPAFLLVKKLTVNNWRLQDSARDPYNPVYHMLAPNSTAGEDAYTDGTDYNDFLSNGFKLARGGDAVNWNASGATYVYLSFAENPFKYATAR